MTSNYFEVMKSVDIKTKARELLANEKISDEFYSSYRFVVNGGIKARYQLNRLRKYGITPNEPTLDISINTKDFLDHIQTSPKPLVGKRIVVEFSSPNIAKRFHMGHIRSTLLGSFLTKLFKLLGASTHSVCYLGDYGKQFGLLGYGYRKYGYSKCKNIDISQLTDIYVRINVEYEAEKKKKSDKYIQMNQDIEAYIKSIETDSQTRDEYELFKRLSLKEYKHQYRRLGIKFDEYTTESEANRHHTLVIGILRARGLFGVDEHGRGFVDLSEFGLGVLIVQKSSGVSLYSSRDLATFIKRVGEHSPDKLYYIVASEQIYYFKQLFKTLELMGFSDWVARTHHIDFGMILGMSTRKGTVVLLDNVVSKTTSMIKSKVNENKEKFNISDINTICIELATSAIRIQDLGARRGRNYEFKYEIITNFHGYSGPYLQYTHARLCGVREKNPNIIAHTHAEHLDDAMLQILIHIHKYNGVLLNCLQALDANTLIMWLFELAKSVNGCYSTHRIKGIDNVKLAATRLSVFNTARVALARGLRLIGCQPIEKM